MLASSEAKWVMESVEAEGNGAAKILRPIADEHRGHYSVGSFEAEGCRGAGAVEAKFYKQRCHEGRGAGRRRKLLSS